MTQTGAILSNPGFQRRTLPLSVESWHRMMAVGIAPSRAELIRGVIVEKMSKTILHTKLAARIFALLQALAGPGFWVRKEDPLTLADSEPEPDVSVVEGREADFESHPATAKLVVEVSVSTLSEDRLMAGIYAEADIPEFWIVNADERCIEVYRNPAYGGYLKQFRVDGGMLDSSALPGVRVDLDEIFKRTGKSV